jgi:lipopolysaccharide transport system permease protein
MNSSPSESNELVIERSHGLRLGSWRELYAYRDLLGLLIWRDIISRYKQTVLGPLWFVVQPILTTITFIVIFSRVARIPTNGVPSSLFYMCGLLPWNYFAQTFQSTSTTLGANSAIFGKVYFPRLIVPLSAVISNFVTVAIQLGTFVVIYALEKVGPRGGSFGMTAWVWLLPLVFIQIGLLSLGIGIGIAALTTKFRDFGVLSGFLLQLWMYATPVVFPLTRVPAHWYWVAAINPMTFPLEITRQMLLGAGTPTAFLFAISIGITLLTTAAGLLVFQSVEKNFVDVI